MANPNIGSVDITVQDGQFGSSFATGARGLVVAGCCEKGPILAAPVQYNDPDAIVTAFGYGPATEYAASHIEETGQPVIFVRMTSSSAGTSDQKDADGVTGTSVITLTGTPLDDYEGIFVVTTGGTISTSGIAFKYSLDGGRTYSPKLSLGTATTYAIPNTGLTLNFAAGTLVADDQYTWTSHAPQWSAAEIDDVMTLLKASTLSHDAIHLVTGLDGVVKADMDTFDTQLAAYESTDRRYILGFSAGRADYPDCRTIGDPDITFDDVASPNEIDRDAGSFVDDGWKVGMVVDVSGSTSNDGTAIGTVSAVAALTLTLTAGDTVTAEGPSAGIEVTGRETDAAYQSSFRATYDAHTSKHHAVGAAAAYRESTIGVANWKFRRPVVWAAVTRFYEFGIENSLAEVANGKLSRTTITDAAGNVAEFDSRQTAGLSSLDGGNGRYITVQTHDGYPGAYISVPSLAHAAGSDFNRVHLRAVVNLACKITQKVLTRELAGDVTLNKKGYIAENEARDIENACRQQYDNEMLSDASGPKASSVAMALSRTDKLGIAGTAATAKVTVQPKGYTEKFAVTVALSAEAAS